MSECYYYKAYGLGIKSESPFPELISKKTGTDVIISFDKPESFPIVKNRFGERISKFKVSFEDIIIYLDSEPLFRVKNGNSIVLNRNFDFNNVFFRSLVLGQGIGILLCQRNRLVFHASAVNINNDAIALLGGSGHGKSTTTFALNNKGHSVISDDVLSVEFVKNNKPLVFPGFPRIKLWDTITKEIAEDNKHSLKRIHPELAKYSYSIQNNFNLDPIPLKRIYVLQKGSKNEIIEIKAQDKLLDLIGNSYCVKIFENKERTKNLKQCGNIVKNVPIKKLIVNHDISQLENLVDMIKNDN